MNQFINELYNLLMNYIQHLYNVKLKNERAIRSSTTYLQLPTSYKHPFPISKNLNQFKLLSYNQL